MVNVRLREKLAEISNSCNECNSCKKQCAFLQKYGNPKHIADSYNKEAATRWLLMAFECSLCGLCTAVCPKGIAISSLLLLMRNEAVSRGYGNRPEHSALINYERRGTSSRYTYYGLPEGCDTVFFPGCTLSGTRSDKVVLAYRRLSERISSLGIVLDCCTKPSHDLGRLDYFKHMFGEMRDFLTGQGVKRVIVACPNCHKIFTGYGSGLSTISIYEVLSAYAGNGNGGIKAAVTVHDPCAVRFDDGMHKAVRELIKRQGYKIEEMPHAGKRTLCCGEGGAVETISPDFAENWARLRRDESGGRQVITYCAGCVGRLSKLLPTAHLLDILLEKNGHGAGGVKVTKPPFTYWKRLRLKRWFKKYVPAAVTRERKFTAQK